MTRTRSPDGPLIGVTVHGEGNPAESFAYRLDAAYAHAVRAAGGVPVLLPILSEHDATSLVRRLDGLILTAEGGLPPDAFTPSNPRPTLEAANPLRYRFELKLIKEALGARLPILGICRGHQMLSEVAGGTLVANIALDWPGALCHFPENGTGQSWHDVDVTPGTRLAELVGSSKCLVNSFHRQAVADAPPGFTVAARAPDGIVEAIENTSSGLAIGVQFHPERLVRSDSRWLTLFAAVVGSARSR